MRCLLPWLLLFPSYAAAQAGEGAVARVEETLFFASDRAGEYEIWSLRDGRLRQITGDPNTDAWWPRLSPDGQRLLFYRSPEGSGDGAYEDAALWVADAGGKNARELIPKGANGWRAQGTAAWSPDGKRLVMAARASDGRWNLYLTGADDRQPVRVNRRTGLFCDPCFAPDGTRLVYSAYPEEYDGLDVRRLEIHTSRLDGSDERRLTDDLLRDHDPCWSPDGSEIAFETAVEPLYLLLGKWALRSVRPDGGGLRTLLDDGQVNSVPRWTSDSKTIYFHRHVFWTAKFHLARIQRDGSGLEDVTTGSRFRDTSVDVRPRRP